MKREHARGNSKDSYPTSPKHVKIFGITHET